MKVLGVIPARYAAQRFPGKPLVDLCGQSMIERVWRAATQAQSLDAVVVATDDERIQKVCEQLGANVIMTNSDIPSGTDRIAQAAAIWSQKKGMAFDIIVNIQGDEPLLEPEVIDALVHTLAEHPTAGVSTPIFQIRYAEDFENPSVVKVACTSLFRALYFSRACIPFARDAENTIERLRLAPAWKHIGLYAYRAEVLRLFTELSISPLENLEKLEQLRLLEHGVEFVCVPTQHDSVAIDTPADAERVRQILKDKLQETS